jgi:hypothetical protein
MKSFLQRSISAAYEGIIWPLIDGEVWLEVIIELEDIEKFVHC